MRILITGGAGFVGSALARYFVDSPKDNTVVVFDNLRRRGAEWNLSGLKDRGIAFVHGDVRNVADLDALDGTFDVLIEASAEPSVHAGIAGSPRYVFDTNLLGALNCLEFARGRCGGFIFLSSSRVYSIEPLINLPLVELPTRFDLRDCDYDIPGISYDGVSEAFANNSYRSYYGASKLAAELLCQEYAVNAKLPVIVNRCGVISGPGQFGKVDQGVFTLWIAHHYFGKALRYTGFGGRGHQVRDLLHPEDLCELVDRQIQILHQISGCTFNVGGGRSGSVSLREYTSLCQEIVGRGVPITEELETKSVDIPWYVSDYTAVMAATGWVPQRTPKKIVEDTADWIRNNEENIVGLLS